MERPNAHVLVMAKSPVPGAVKTRLMPRFSDIEAARIAEAALLDTLAAVRACSGALRRVLALAGDPLTDFGTDFEVVAQRGASFNDRLHAAWADAGVPGLQIGMDTPQVTPALLDDALDRLANDQFDALVGLACDGGWWALGLRTPAPGAFHGVEMSRADTGRRQIERLQRLGLRVGLLPELRDIDEADDLFAVAAAHPHLRVAHEARQLAAKLAP